MESQVAYNGHCQRCMPTVYLDFNTASPLSLALTAVQQKVSEESVARMRAESRAVEVVKRCSTLELDLKQSLQKMEQLMKQKERLEDEVRRWWRRGLHQSTGFSPLLGGSCCVKACG